MEVLHMLSKSFAFILLVAWKFNIFAATNEPNSDSYFLPCASQIYQNFLKNHGSMSSELHIIIGSPNEMLGMDMGGQSLLNTAVAGDSGAPTFQVEFYDRHRHMPNWLDQLLWKTYSNANCFEVLVFIRLGNLSEALIFLEKIGIFEGHRISPINFRLACAPNLFIMWNNSSEAQFKEILEHNQTRHLPGLASHVYFVLPNKNGLSPETLSCSVFEVYTFPSSTASPMVINFVPPNAIGNLMNTRTNLHGYTLRAGAVGQQNRYGHGNGFSDDSIGFGYVGTNLVGAGISERVLGYFQQFFGFDVQLITTSSWIEAPTNGTWIGLGKLLTDGSIDISIDQSIYLPFRTKFFTLLLPTYDKDSMNIYFRQPPASSVRNVFILPFSTGVWIGAFGILILGLALFALLIRLNGSFPMQFNLSIKNEVEVFANNYALWLILFFTNQGWFQEPKQTFLRIIFLVGSLMGLILYTAYTANLVSVFTSQEKPIKNIDDFVGSSLDAYAPGTSTIIQQIFNVKLQSNKPDQLEKTIVYSYNISELLRESVDKSSSSGSYGIIGFSYWYYSQMRFHVPDVMDSWLCTEISEIQTTFGTLKSGLIVQKNSPFKEMFNSRIVNLYESGIIRREQKSFINSFEPICGDKNYQRSKILYTNTEDADEGHGLSIADTWTAFLIVGAGGLIALFILVCEWSWNKAHHRT